MGWLRDDLRVALRRCRRQPGFTFVVVLTLALGLGANTAVFTMIDAVMLRSLPVQKPGELYRLGDTNNCCVNSGLQRSWSLFPWALFNHLKANAPEFSELAALQASGTQIGVRRGGAGLPETMPGQFVTANYFRLFGVTPAAGRLFEPADDQSSATPVVVLSYRAWERFGLDPAIVGSVVTLNGFSATVAGVASGEFFGDTIRPDPTGVWIPIGQEPAMRGEQSLLSHDDQQWLYAIGRLRAGTPTKPISARLTTALQQWLSAQPFIAADARAKLAQEYLVVVPAGGGVPVLQRQFSQSLRLMLLTSAVLLLIACANLANLLLARADRGQAAIRAALGASGSRLLRQSIVEGVLLATAGAVAGMAVANAGTRALISLAFPGGVFVPVDASPSLTVLLFTCGLAVLTGVIFSAAPAWAMSRTAPLDALAGVGRNMQQMSFVPRRSLVITQVALSFAMITSAALLVSSLSHLEHQRLGFDPSNRLVIQMQPPVAVRQQQDLFQMYEHLRERLARIPGVQSASYSLSSPMDGNNWQSRISIAGRTPDPNQPDSASWNRVGPDYFATVGSRILRGRGIDARDVPGSRRVALVNETFANRYFDAVDPIGKTAGIGGVSHSGDFEIVGVVEDVKYSQANVDAVRPMLFLAGFQSGDYSDDPSSANVQLRSMALRSIVIHARDSAGSLEGPVRSALAEVNGDINVIRVLPLTLQVSGNFRIQRLLSRLTSVYAGLALVLTALGLFGVTSYGVARRTREIGVRMALGADRASVMKTVIGGPLVETLIGLAIGLPLAMLAGRAMQAQLYGLSSHHPLMWTLTIALLVTTSILAAAIPARRAASIDPSKALRGD